MGRGSYTAVVLTGGQSRRFGSGDKTAALVAGRTLLQRVVDSVIEAEAVVVVGPTVEVHTPRALMWTREHPPGSGPLAGVAAAVPLVGTDAMVLLAGDMPFGRGLPGVLLDVLASRPAADGVVPIDAAGHAQPLAAAYRTAALREVLERLQPVAGRPMRHLLDELDIVSVGHEALPPRVLVDVDTRAELAAARAMNPDPPLQEEQMLQDWTMALIRELDVDVQVDEDLLLELARDAAHSVSRPAAPITTFLVGYAAALRGGGTDAVAQASDTARLLAARWTPPAQA